jgi:DNA polymerase-1
MALMFFDNLGELKRNSLLRIPPPYINTKWRPPTHFPNLSAAKIIGFDVERRELDWSHGPGWGKGKAITIGFSLAASDGQNISAWYFPIRHEVQPEHNLDPIRCLSYLRSVLRSNVPKVGANIIYDIGSLTDDNIEVHGELHDVQFAEALLHSDELVNLDHLGEKYLGRGKETNQLYEWIKRAYPDRQKNSDPRANIWRAPPCLAGPYGESDALMPILILEKQWPLLERNGLIDLYRMECGLIPLLVKMRLEGVTVNVQAAYNLYNELEIDIRNLYAKLYHDAPVKIESVNSGRDLAKIFDYIGLHYPTTDAGNPSFRKDFLTNLDHPIADTINEIRGYEKARGTFIRNYILESNVNGKIYCQFHPLQNDDGGTKTGRFSSSDPNLQNIPARTELGIRIRKCFTGDEGQQWEKIDYCVAPDTRILTSDMQHLRADKIKVGQELVGFDKHVTWPQIGTARKLRKTKVVAIKRLKQPCYRVTTNKGQFVSSALHQWLARSYDMFFQWVKTEQLKVGMKLPRFCNTWDLDESRESGWLSGLLDGEGWICNGCLSIAQNEGNGILDRAKKWLEQNGFEFSEANKENLSNSLITLRIKGGRQKQWELLGRLRPTRLIANVQNFIEGYTIRSKCNPPDTITAIDFLGEQDVIGIQTEHGTIIANGILSSNSQIEYRYLAHYAVGGGADELRAKYCQDKKTDYHVTTQSTVKELTGIVIERRPIKNLNFGLVFGMGEPKLARQNNFDKDEAKTVFAAYHKSNPYVKETAKAIATEAKIYGYITTILGRRIHFNLWEPTDRDYRSRDRPTPLPYTMAIKAYGSRITRANTHKAVNYRLQGSGTGDQIKMGMYQCFKQGIFDYIGVPRIQVHDELGMSVKNDSPAMNEAYRAMRHVMETCIPIKVPVFVDSKRGDSWGACE